ncbi:hypothetical protein ABPG74_015697 [Tetrahymena malaccensis]
MQAGREDVIFYKSLKKEGQYMLIVQTQIGQIVNIQYKQGSKSHIIQYTEKLNINREAYLVGLKNKRKTYQKQLFFSNLLKQAVVGGGIQSDLEKRQMPQKLIGQLIVSLFYFIFHPQMLTKEVYSIVQIIFKISRFYIYQFIYNQQNKLKKFILILIQCDYFYVLFLDFIIYLFFIVLFT